MQHTVALRTKWRDELLTKKQTLHAESLSFICMTSCLLAIYSLINVDQQLPTRPTTVKYSSPAGRGIYQQGGRDGQSTGRHGGRYVVTCPYTHRYHAQSESSPAAVQSEVERVIYRIKHPAMANCICVVQWRIKNWPAPCPPLKFKFSTYPYSSAVIVGLM